MRDFAEERRKWVPICDFYLWAILKAIEENKVRSFHQLATELKVGSTTTILQRWHFLVRTGFIRRGEDMNYVLTETGKKLLEAFDTIGELAQKIRRKHPELAWKMLFGRVGGV